MENVPPDNLFDWQMLLNLFQTGMTDVFIGKQSIDNKLRGGVMVWGRYVLCIPEQ